jgi:hypothetical protein
MASGQTLVAFEPTDYRPPTTNYATLDLRNGIPVIDFDAAVAEATSFCAVLPRHYGGGGITARIAWMATTAVSGQVQWSVAIERHDPTTDLDADSFASAVSSALATTSATSGAPIYTEVALTNAQIDGLLAGEHFRVKLSRLVAGGMAGDAEVLSLELRET